MAFNPKFLRLFCGEKHADMWLMRRPQNEDLDTRSRRIREMQEIHDAAPEDDICPICLAASMEKDTD